MEPVRAVPPPGRPDPPRAESPQAAVELARLLRVAGYESPRIQERLATGDELLARSPELPSYLRRLGDADELAVLLRLFLLGVPVARARLDELVGTQLRARLAGAGLLVAGRRRRPRGGAPRPPRRAADRVRSCGRGGGARRPRAGRAPPVRRPRPPDRSRRGRARPRPVHRQRDPGDPARRARRARRRDRREREGARLRGVQRGAQRRRQRRDASRQLLRAGRGRAVRPRRRQPAVRRLAGERVPVPGRRHARRRRLGARRAGSAGRARAGRVRLRPDRLGARPGRPCGAPAQLAGGLGLRRVPAPHLDGRPDRDRDRVESRSPRPARGLRRGAGSLARVLPRARDRAARLRVPGPAQARRRHATAGSRRSSCRGRRFARRGDTCGSSSRRATA